MANVENLIVLDGYWKDGEEHWGSDYKGNEVLTGDEIVIDPANDEVVRISGHIDQDLKDYLVEKLGFEFKVAE